MKKFKYYLTIFFFIIFPGFLCSQEIDLSIEYSMDEFQNGIRAFHEAEYERAITFFIKSLSFNEDNYLSRYYLGESYRKAGYENNAIFVWNNLLALGYSDRTLRSKLSYLYNKKGILNEININKKFILREDIKGYYDNTTSPLFMKPSQIFIDKNNHYYIASFLTGMILELDPNLRIVKNHFPVINKFEKPFGIAVDKDGLIYVSDFGNDEIVVIDRNGLIKRKIGYKGIGKGGLLGPQYLLFDDEENLYVTDSGNHRVNKYNKNGDPLFSIGYDKSLDGLLEKPAGMYYFNNNIYICDRKLNEVLVYDKSGNYVKSFGKNKLDEPFDITRDNFGRFMILCRNKLWVYEEENNL